jgi:hypothetical protein
MATMLEEFITEEQCCVVLFLWSKGLNARDIRKEMFPVYGGKCGVKRFTSGSGNSLNDVRKSQMMPDQVRKWLRQQSKDFYAADFDALVKRRYKCIKVGGGYVEKQVFFFQVPISHVLRFMFICDLFTHSPL